MKIGIDTYSYHRFLGEVYPKQKAPEKALSYPEIVKLARGKSVLVETDNNYLPDLEKLQAVVTPKTKAILLNSPNNPTGAVYPPEFVAGLVDFCESREIYLIMDDIYHQLVFKPAEWVPGYVFTSSPNSPRMWAISAPILTSPGPSSTISGFRESV